MNLALSLMLILFLSLGAVLVGLGAAMLRDMRKEKKSEKRKRQKSLLQQQKEIISETSIYTLNSWRIRNAMNTAAFALDNIRIHDVKRYIC